MRPRKALCVRVRAERDNELRDRNVVKQECVKCPLFIDLMTKARKYGETVRYFRYLNPEFAVITWRITFSAITRLFSLRSWVFDLC